MEEHRSAAPRRNRMTRSTTTKTGRIGHMNVVTNTQGIEVQLFSTHDEAVQMIDEALS